MPGAAGGVASAPAHAARLAAGAWTEPVVITGCTGAIDGALELPPEIAGAVVRGPFDDVRLPGAPVAPAAQALVAAIGRLLADPATGEPPAPERRAIVVGTRAAALSETILFMGEVAANGPALVNPGLFPFTVMNAAAGLAAIQHGCRGANVTLASGASSVLDALIYAADLVASGRADLVFAGGFEGLGEQASLALGRSAPPLVVAVVAAVTTRAAALAAGARPIARLLAWSSGEVPGLAPAAARREIESAALGAAEPLLGRSQPGPSQLGPSAPADSRPEAGLLALLSAVTSLAAAGAAEAASLAAGPEDRAAGTALVLGGAGGWR